MGDPARGLVANVSTLINGPPRAVWVALTDPDKIRQYMFGAQVDSEWRKGSRIMWRGEWQGRSFEDQGVILDLEPERLIRYTHFSRLSGLPDLPENYHVVTVRLASEGSGTRVLLTQDNNESEEARAHSEGSWKMMLSGLKVLVEG